MKKKISRYFFTVAVPLAFTYIPNETVLAKEIERPSVEISQNIYNSQGLIHNLFIEVENGITIMRGQMKPHYVIILKSEKSKFETTSDDNGEFHFEIQEEINPDLYTVEMKDGNNDIIMEDCILSQLIHDSNQTDGEDVSSIGLNDEGLSPEVAESEIVEIETEMSIIEESDIIIETKEDVIPSENTSETEPVEKEIQGQEIKPTTPSKKLVSSKVAVAQIGKTSYIVYQRDFDNIDSKTSKNVIESIVNRLKSEMNISVTKENLIKWNNINDVSKIKIGDILFVDGQRPKDFDNSNKKPYSNSQEFLKLIIPYAQKVAGENNIYSSVMIAQAIKETGWGTSDLSQPPFNNFFGIKASNSDEYSVIKETWENIDGKNVKVLAAFKVFNTYYDSFLENAKKIRDGVSWDSKRYSGAWMENALYYSDATKWLTGRYATDPDYYKGLDEIIEKNNLVKYDTHKLTTILKQENTNYKKIIRKSGYTIDSKPYRTSGFSFVDYSSNYIGQTVTVKKEATTKDATYLLIYKDGKQIGWVNQKATDPIYKVKETRSVSYQATIKGNNHNIFSQPAMTEGSENVAFSSNYKGKKVAVYSEKVTDLGVYALVNVDGVSLGWINISGLTHNFEKIKEARGVAYEATIKGNGHNIFNTPAWTEGNVKVANASDYKMTNIKVYSEKVTAEGVYAQVKIAGEEIGWINIKGLNLNYTDVKETNGVSYKAAIKGNGHNIFSEPAWSKGNKKVANTSDFSGKEFTVYAEKITANGTYARVQIDGKNIGWVDKKGILPLYETISKTHGVAYEAIIKSSGNNIFSTPAWTKDNKKVANASDYKDVRIQVYTEKETSEGIYVEVKIDGKTLGWINTKGIEQKFEPVKETRSVSYNASIKGNGHNIYSSPAWTKGNRKVANTSDYRGKEFTVYSEKLTNKSTYVQVRVDGKIIGWVDKKGLQPLYKTVKETRSTAYEAIIKGNGHNIFSTPAWTEGNYKTANASQYANENVVIYSEKVTEDGVFAQVKAGNKTIGWINTQGITPKYHNVEETRDVSYEAYVLNNGNNIYSTPAWTEGNKKVANLSDFRDKVVVIKKEKFTQLGRFFLLNLNGKELGWVHHKGVKMTRPVVYIDAGHGGDDPGAVSANAQEARMNLVLAEKVERILRDKNVEVIMGRVNDSTYSLSQRAQEANALGAEFFVSIHHNAFNGSAQGIETFYYDQKGDTTNPNANDKDRISKSKALATELQKELVSETGAVDRGVKEANFHVLRETKMPSALLEAGFLDNAKERANLLLNSYQDKIAKAIASGIEKFVKLFF